MNNQTNNTIIEVLAEAIDIPESTYIKAEQRYRDLGKWLGRGDSVCAPHDTHVFPQGSFRLGTVVRPISGEEEYDLDLACELQKGIAKAPVGYAVKLSTKPSSPLLFKTLTS